MRVLFAYPNATRTDHISYGLAYLSACLKTHGHETSLLDLHGGLAVRPGQVRQVLEELEPDLVAITAMSVDYPLAIRLARQVKACRRDQPVLLGGIHATVTPESVIVEDAVDMLCIGEGEEALADLCNRWAADGDVLGTPNFWFKQDGEIVRNAQRPLTQDLDSLPFPDRLLFDFDRYLEAMSGQLAILASRGCPYRCTYCANSSLQRLYSGQRFVRSRSVENVLREIEECVGRSRVQGIEFLDDMFVADRPWVLEFCQQYPDRVGLPFRCCARVEHVNDEVCSALARAGCTWLFMGIEAGDPSIRRNVLGRAYADDQVVDAFRIARAHGLKVASFNMIGLPHETAESVHRTVQLNRTVRPDDLRVSIFQPYHGTEIRHLCIAEGWIDADTQPGDFLQSVVRLPGLTSREIQTFRRRFGFLVYWPEQRLKALVFYLAGLAHAPYVRVRRYLPGPLVRLVRRAFGP